MTLKTGLLCAGLSDTGRARKENEDRILVDGERGLFIVADGLGGHAAGEQAAETAVEMIKARLARPTGSVEDRMREAIAVANNEIHAQASRNPEWKGMACVVTAALIEDGYITVGHVGDSRLYLLEPGSIRKLTPDHSPVGELEDSGALSEAAAMAHPRRNEVFRDLGSEPHAPDDEEFIDILRFPFRANAAILLCSDGLTDQIPADRIRRTVEAYPRDPESAVRALVDSANDAGGKDNVSVILIEGPEYNTTRPASTPVTRTPIRRMPLFVPFLLGFVAAVLLFGFLRPYLRETTDGVALHYGTVRGPLTWKVGPGGMATIAEAMGLAQAGDTVVVEPGIYREPVRLRAGVALVSAVRRQAVLEGRDSAVMADSIRHARLIGFRIAGAPRTGIHLVSSEVEITDCEITGATEAGIDFEGDSAGAVRANTISGNPGAGVVVRGGSKPVITNNHIVANGRTPGQLRPGVFIAGTAAPVVSGNVIAESGAEQVWVSPLFNAEALAATNLLAPGVKDRKTLIKVVTR